MKKEYDDIIEKHYSNVAKEQGISSKSTMLDEITRDLETKAISKFVGECLKLRQENNSTEKITIMDVGCGNGYTLDQLVYQYPNHNYVGIEQSNELRELAASRFKENDRVTILEGDIRDRNFTNNIEPDILICQRVLINLLDAEDQKSALNNIVAIVRSPNDSSTGGGNLLFIESFIHTLNKLNEARTEFDLPPIPPAHHNLYLPEDFFHIPELKPLAFNGEFMPSNFLSTHFYVTRVLHPMFIPKNTPFKRNSDFVKFFREALNQNIGDYSPLKLYIFEKKIKS